MSEIVTGDALVVLPVDGARKYVFDFSADVPSASPEITVSGIDYSIPTQLESFVDTDDLASAKGTLGLRATASGKHGMTLQVACTANLSNSEKVIKYMTVRLSGS